MDQLDKAQCCKSGFSYSFGIWHFGIGVICWLNNSMQQLTAGTHMPGVQNFIGIAYIYRRTITQSIVINMNAAALISIRLPEQTYYIIILQFRCQVVIKIFNGIFIRWGTPAF